MALEKEPRSAYKGRTGMETSQEIAQKRFDAQDKQWTGPRFIVLALVVLVIAISTIYWMSTTTGCSLQVVP